MDKTNRGRKLIARQRSASSPGQTAPRDTRTRWGMGTCTFPSAATPNPNCSPGTAAVCGASAPCTCARAREGAAHDLNVPRVPHALRREICVPVDTTCLGPDKRHLIDTEKGADKRPSGAGELCTILGAGTTRKGGGSRQAGGSRVAFKDTSGFHIKKKLINTLRIFQFDGCAERGCFHLARGICNTVLSGARDRGSAQCQVKHTPRDNCRAPSSAQSIPELP